MSQDSDPNKSSFFTLKRVLICLGLVGIVVSVVLEVLRSKEHQQWEIDRTTCLEAMGRMHKALTLYRADNDDFSPAFEEKGRELMMERLKRYAGNKAINCEIDGSTGRPELRVAEKSSTSKVMSPFGVEDNSLELEPCYEHMRYHSFARMAGWMPSSSYEPEFPTGGVLNVLLRSGTAKPIPGTTEDATWIVQSGVIVPEGKPTHPLYGRSIRLMPFEPRPPKFEY